MQHNLHLRFSFRPRFSCLEGVPIPKRYSFLSFLIAFRLFNFNGRMINGIEMTESKNRSSNIPRRARVGIWLATCSVSTGPYCPIELPSLTACTSTKTKVDTGNGKCAPSPSDIEGWQFSRKKLSGMMGYLAVNFRLRIVCFPPWSNELWPVMVTAPHEMI